MLLTPPRVKPSQKITIKIPIRLYTWLSETAIAEEKDRSQIINDALRDAKKQREQENKK